MIALIFRDAAEARVSLFVIDLSTAAVSERQQGPVAAALPVIAV